MFACCPGQFLRTRSQIHVFFRKVPSRWYLSSNSSLWLLGLHEISDPSLYFISSLPLSHYWWQFLLVVCSVKACIFESFCSSIIYQNAWHTQERTKCCCWKVFLCLYSRKGQKKQLPLRLACAWAPAQSCCLLGPAALCLGERAQKLLAHPLCLLPSLPS